MINTKPLAICDRCGCGCLDDPATLRLEAPWGEPPMPAADLVAVPLDAHSF